MAEAELRLRRPGVAEDEAIVNPDARYALTGQTTPQREQKVVENRDSGRKLYGKTPDGAVFAIPQTHDMLSSLLDPRLPKSHLDLLTLGLLGLQILLFAVLGWRASRAFFLGYFVFWRSVYNLGLGIVLKRQSEKRWIVKTVKRLGLMDPVAQPNAAAWIQEQLQSKMGPDYDPEAVPLEYKVWLIFRQVVDIILLNDFMAYFLFCAASITFPPGHSNIMHILRWISGWSLVAFNIWVKADAHRIVHDFAWYWGDTFYISIQDLVFDGVFEMAPHPMYSIGYAGFYGASLITGSLTVLLISLMAHMAQFAFLVFFENPHIERTYGQKKPLTHRQPLRPHADTDSVIPPKPKILIPCTASPLSTRDQTPSQTEADTSDTESAGPDSDFDDLASIHPAFLRNRETYEHRRYKSRTMSGDSHTSSNTALHSLLATSPPLGFSGTAAPTGPVEATMGVRNARPLTRQDLENRYFRKDLIVFRNFDPFRSRDFSAALVVFYTFCAMFLPSDMSGGSHLALVAANAIAWRLFFTFGLGMALKWQSEDKWLVRHFLKRYHYDIESSRYASSAVDETFENWKSIYNTSLVMTYVSFGALAWKFYSIPHDWTIGTELLRHTLGLCLIGLHCWASRSTYDVLGDFGWFYGDFFIEDYPIQLAYTGIYRFLNNPERSMGGAAFFGLVLISGSKVVLTAALFSVLCHWWFLSHVENPHMRKLYGDAIRKEAGLTKTLKNAAKRNAHLARHAPPELAKKIKEVQGTFEHIYDEAAEALDDFLGKSAPRLSGVVKDTKVLLQQSSERLVFTRVASDLSQYDPSQYKVAVEPSPFAPPSTDGSPLRFHLGEPITLNWSAPLHHSRRDWIGIYRCGANKSRHVTRTTSQGRWKPLYEEEWDGDLYIGTRASGSQFKAADTAERKSSSVEHGQVTFGRATLPWKEGIYEFRLHHDGKHNVMATDVVRIFIEKSRDDSPKAVHDILARVVAFALSLEATLIPATAFPALQGPTEAPRSLALGAGGAKETGGGPDAVAPDPDDFTVMDQEQADHIAYAVSQAFDIELGSGVIVADANVAKLATRVLSARELLRPFSPVSPQLGATVW